MKLSKNRVDVLSGWCASYDPGCRILEELEFVKRFVRDTKEKRIPVINSRSDKAMDKDSSSMWGEERTETTDVA